MNPSTLSTAELRKLEREHQHPTSMPDALTLRGIRAELSDPERRSGFVDPVNENIREELAEAESKIDDLEDKNSDLASDLEEAEGELRKLGKS